MKPRVIWMASLLGGIFGLSTACAGTSPWTEVAARARRLGPDQVQRAERGIDGLDGDREKRAEALLGRLSQSAPDAAGLNAAAQDLAASLPGFADPSRPTEGTDPAVGAVRAAALCVFQGLAVRAGEAAKAGAHPSEDAESLLRAVAALPGFGDADRGLLREELRQGLGSELYLGAFRAVSAP